MANVDKIRVSIGSAVKLGLKRLKVDVLPTNCHLLTYHPDGCWGNCGFCPQSQFTHDQLTDSEEDQEYLSRVLWPIFDLNEVLSLFQEKFPKFSTKDNGFQRICIQSLYYKHFEYDIEYILQNLRSVTSVPISIAIPPVKEEEIRKYKEIGVERICFALDTATSALFSTVKGSECNGPYSWEEHMQLLEKSVEIFGNGFVSTHLIIGLGETEKEILQFIQNMKDLGVRTGLFAFYPIKKTRFESRTRPNLISFRKSQLAKYLLDTGKFRYEDFIFDNNGSMTKIPISQTELQKLISLSAPFETSGCPGCNRPYYTSTPREEQYNFPRRLTELEQVTVYKELKKYCKEDGD
jgi:biotin synthase